MHFMNPVPVMQLVEVAKGVHTSQQTFEACKGLAEFLGKQVCTSQDRPVSGRRGEVRVLYCVGTWSVVLYSVCCAAYCAVLHWHMERCAVQRVLRSLLCYTASAPGLLRSCELSVLRRRAHQSVTQVIIPPPHQHETLTPLPPYLPTPSLSSHFLPFISTPLQTVSPSLPPSILLPAPPPNPAPSPLQLTPWPPPTPPGLPGEPGPDPHDQ